LNITEVFFLEGVPFMKAVRYYVRKYGEFPPINGYLSDKYIDYGSLIGGV
jgi:hypothetical protein